ncbi:MAG: hypothetical protein PHF26_04770, partial [Candidatus Gracilibacteria bacterium]|nr:hypothetical protein [Candidatus Gracilibacteria bacterium]
MKKIIASLSVVTLLAMNVLSSTVSAAGIAVDSATYDDGTDTITVTDAGKNYIGDNVTTLVVKTPAGTPIVGVDATDVTEANDSFAITDVALDALVAGIYSVSFVTTAGDFSAVTVNIGNANQVAVTARVLPTLTLSVANPTVALGALSVAGAVSSATDPAATVTTNAVHGLTLTVASANHGLTSANAA